MTNAPTKNWFRRHPVLSFTALLLLAGSAWLGIIVATFDIAEYRQKIEQELSSHLSLAVDLGKIEYRFHDASLALMLENTVIGDDDDALSIRAPKLWLELSWFSLLFGSLQVSEIELYQPFVRIHQGRLPSGDGDITEGSAPILIDSALFTKSFVRALTLVEGKLALKRPAEAGDLEEIIFSDLSGTLTNLGLGRRVQADLSGELQIDGESTSWELLSSLQVPSDLAQPEFGYFELNLTMQDFAARQITKELIPADLPAEVAGHCRFKLHLSGDPTENIHIHSTIEGRDLQIHPGPPYQEFIPVGHLSLNGNWKPTNGLYRFENMAAQVDDLRIAGDLQLSNQPKLSGQLRLTNAVLPLQSLKPWLPPVAGFTGDLLNSLQEKGTIWLNGAVVNIPGWQIEQLDGHLEGIAWASGESQPVILENLTIKQTGAEWLFSHGVLKAGVAPLRFQAEVTTPLNDKVSLMLGAETVFRIEDLPASWTDQLPKDLQVRGKLPLKISTEGPIDELKFDLSADLSALALDYSDLLHLDPTPDAEIALHASLSEETFQIDHGRFQWGSLQGRIDGDYSWEERAARFKALLSSSDLSEAGAISPALENLDLSGQVDIAIDLVTSDAETTPEYTITLRDVGISTGPLIGDLSQTNGRIRITGKRLESEKLIARLGGSPFSAQIQIDDLTRPRAAIDVDVPSLRADELIFPSDISMLRNIRGLLLIDGEKLELSDVAVELDEGTRASVDGTIQFKPDIDIFLDITGNYAHVGEIIGLWTNRTPKADTKHEKPATDPSQKKDRKVSVTIQAHAIEGDLYGMKFQEATALIVPTSRELVIHPLDFQVDQGYCNAQVIVDFTVEGPPLLRVSGHVEEVDAYQIYHELLDQKSIVRGNMRGDFYLQGQVGSSYLPTSRGRINLEIRNGVLRKLPTLSKVFSILNVSQLFAFKLPDMNKEGMPFSLMTGNLDMEKGIISTEDLFIKSEAMNQAHIGKIDMVNKTIDMDMSFHPLGTVDKVVSRVPVAGWLLTGDEKALITTHFKATGDRDNPTVKMTPIDTFSKKTIGLLQRTLGLPVKLITDPQIIWGGSGAQKK